MKVQSLSIVVPSKGCINNCEFCVSRMHDEPYANMLDGNKPFYDLYEKDYIRRLEFARDNGCNTVMLTGDCEPQQNREFLQRFGSMNNSLSSPFRWIEMQTTGALLDRNYLWFLRNHVGVSTISVSVSSLNDDLNNQIINSAAHINLKQLCEWIKEYDFNLRISLNLLKNTEKMFPEMYNLFTTIKDLGADQLTFRYMYSSDNSTPQSRFVKENKISDCYSHKIENYVYVNGRSLERLEYGAMKYSLHSMSVVIDSDCMATSDKEELKYLILRPNCKLYSKWDDPASLIF